MTDFVEGKIHTLKLDQLRLDPENPRLPYSIKRTPDAMFEYLAYSTSIDELVSAIAHNDFFQGEALIGVQDENDPKYYNIVEGNRRLTALLILNNPSLVEGKARLFELANNAINRPPEVPVALYSHKDKVLNYLGNRHIAGVKPWSPLAKARYINTLFSLTNDKLSYDDKCREVAATIGSRMDYINKSLKAISALAIYEKLSMDLPEKFSDVEIEEIAFSLLTTALGYSDIKQFFELDDEIAIYTKNNIDTERFIELFGYLFVPREGESHPPIGESRNLTMLMKILPNDKALEAFRSGASISQAFILTDGVDHDFKQICFQAQDKLRAANAIAEDVHIDNSSEEVIDSIFRQARRLKRTAEGE